MIHIGKSVKTGQFQVTVVAPNGEPLSTSELLSTKAKAFNNALSQRHSFETHHVIVQDDTPAKPILYMLQAGEKPSKLNDVTMQYKEVTIQPKHIVGKKPTPIKKK